MVTQEICRVCESAVAPNAGIHMSYNHSLFLGRCAVINIGTRLDATDHKTDCLLLVG